MKHLALSLLLVFLSFTSFANQDELSKFVPKGFKILFQYTADLNADSIPDKIIIVGVNKSLGDSVLKSLFPDDMNYQKRPVIILLGQKDHSFKRVTRNDNAIAQSLGTKDPFSRIKCETGVFTIVHTIDASDEQCTVESRFEWVNKQSDWYLKNYSQSCISAKTSLDQEGAGFREKTPKNFGKITPMTLEIDEWGQ